MNRRDERLVHSTDVAPRDVFKYALAKSLGETLVGAALGLLSLAVTATLLYLLWTVMR